MVVDGKGYGCSKGLVFRARGWMFGDDQYAPVVLEVTFRRIAVEKSWI